MKTYNSEILNSQKVNIPLTEKEITHLIDLCVISKESLETFAPKEHLVQAQDIENIQSKLNDAYQAIWQIKEIKTRKSNILTNDELSSKKTTPKIMEM